MKPCRTLRALLLGLAIVGLVLWPIAGPALAMTGGASADLMQQSAAAMPGDMPCCPDTSTPAPDCAKHCPLLAMCLASVLPYLAVPAGLSTPRFSARVTFPDRSSNLDSLAQAPPPRPPKT